MNNRHLTMHEQELTDLYAEQRLAFVGFAIKRTRDPVLAEDLTQEAFTRAWDKREQFKGGNMGGWVFMIMINLIRDRSKRWRESLTEDGELRDLSTPVHEPEGFLDLIEQLKDMPEIDQEAFVLVAAGFNGEQLSERWNVPKVTANHRVFRARRRVERNESVNL